MYSNLMKYGLTERFKQEASDYEGLFPARVSSQHRDLYKVIGERGELNAVVSGKLAYRADGRLSFPAVGDFVTIDRQDAGLGSAVIHHVLRRKSVFTRKSAGTANEEQVVAANIDTVFICISLNADFNLRRAIQDGTLSEKRFDNYLKLRREIAYDGLNSRQLENEKINRMFGSKSEMKQALKQIKNKKRTRGQSCWPKSRAAVRY
jgi:putative ribosome biogenesis GTPase RsgA